MDGHLKEARGKKYLELTTIDTVKKKSGIRSWTCYKKGQNMVGEF